MTQEPPEGRAVLNGWISRVRRAWDAGDRIEAIRCYRAAKQTARLFRVALTASDQQLLALVARYEGNNLKAVTSKEHETATRGRLPGCGNTPVSTPTVAGVSGPAVPGRNIPDATEPVDSPAVKSTKPVDSETEDRAQARRRAEGLLAQSRAALEPSRKASATILSREADRIDNVHNSLKKKRTSTLVNQLAVRRRPASTITPAETATVPTPTVTETTDDPVALTPKNAPSSGDTSSTPDTPTPAKTTPASPTIPKRSLATTSPAETQPAQSPEPGSFPREPLAKTTTPLQQPAKSKTKPARTLPLPPGSPPAQAATVPPPAVKHAVIVPPVTTAPQTKPATPQPAPALAKTIPASPGDNVAPPSGAKDAPSPPPSTVRPSLATDSSTKPSASKPVDEPPPAPAETSAPPPIEPPSVTDATVEPDPAPTITTDNEQLNQLIKAATPKQSPVRRPELAPSTAVPPAGPATTATDTVPNERQILGTETVLVVVAPILLALLILGMLTQEMPLPNRLLNALSRWFVRLRRTTSAPAAESQNISIPASRVAEERPAAAKQPLLIRIVSKKRSGASCFTACILLPGTEPTRMVRQRDGQPYFRTRSAALTSARHLARRLGFDGIAEEPSTASQRRAAA